MNIDNILIIFPALILMALEYFFPLRNYEFWNKHRQEDLVWVLNREIVFVFLFAGTLFTTKSFICEFLSKHQLVLDLQSQNVLLQGGVLLLALDFASYCMHRTLHTFEWPWKMHRLHHSSLELTILSSFRISWGEGIVTGIVFGIISGIVLVPTPVYFYINFLFVFACLIQHSNIKFRYPAFLGKILITPRNHLWHHSSELKHQHGQNFGFVLVFWDKILKTHYDSKIDHTPLGFSDGFEYQSFLSKVLYPFDIWFKKIILLISRRDE